jgi:hypothetical protein
MSSRWSGAVSSGTSFAANEAERNQEETRKAHQVLGELYTCSVPEKCMSAVNQLDSRIITRILTLSLLNQVDRLQALMYGWRNRIFDPSRSWEDIVKKLLRHALLMEPLVSYDSATQQFNLLSDSSFSIHLQKMSTLEVTCLEVLHLRNAFTVKLDKIGEHTRSSDFAFNSVVAEAFPRGTFVRAFILNEMAVYETSPPHDKRTQLNRIDVALQSILFSDEAKLTKLNLGPVADIWHVLTIKKNEYTPALFADAESSTSNATSY